MATSDSDAKVALRRIREREIDRDLIDQELLDVSVRDRRNALAWRGQFTPGLPDLLLEIHQTTGLVLDPFVGSGTTLGAAARRGLPSFGCEINPAALTLSKIYEFACISVAERAHHIEAARMFMRQACLAPVAIGRDEEDLDPRRVAERIRDNGGLVEQILSPVFMLALGNGKLLTRKKLLHSFDQVEALICDLPDEPVALRVVGQDARNLKSLGHQAELVITSPPYINVFNYHQNYRFAVECLGWDVLPAARSEIGSNRKHRQNRFLTVIQYCIDMALTLESIVLSAKDSTPIVMVLGRESQVRGVSFPNGDIVAALADLSENLVLERWQERSFTNRFGKRIHEEVLTIRTVRCDSQSADGREVTRARELGVVILDEVLAVPDLKSDVRIDIEAAMNSSSNVEASPPLTLARAAS